MFLPDYNNLLIRKKNVLQYSNYINTLDLKALKEALEIQGKIIFKFDDNTLQIDNVFGVSFLKDIYYSFLDKKNLSNEINIHYWEDWGHRIDIFKENTSVKIVNYDSNKREFIVLPIEIFFNEIKDVINSIYILVYAVYYPEIDSKEFFEELKKYSQINLKW